MGACSVEGKEVPCIEVVSPKGTKVSVFQKCIEGSCDCKYYIAGVEIQLKPCRFASIICKVGNSWASGREKLLWLVTDGFPIVQGEVPQN